jgi:hypothetical protein
MFESKRNLSIQQCNLYLQERTSPSKKRQKVQDPNVRGLASSPEKETGDLFSQKNTNTTQSSNMVGFQNEIFSNDISTDQEQQLLNAPLDVSIREKSCVGDYNNDFVHSKIDSTLSSILSIFPQSSTSYKNDEGRKLQLHQQTEELSHGDVSDCQLPSQLSSSILHQVCSGSKQCVLTHQEIDLILKNHPSTASRHFYLYDSKVICNNTTCTIERRVVREKYGYAINLAIQNKHIQDKKILIRLLDAFPQVIKLPDGSCKESTLHCLLKYRPYDVEMADIILLKDISTASMVDCKGNTPLHIAVSSVACIEIIHHLFVLYPQALTQRNFDGLTPLDLAERLSNHLYADDVADYLREEMEMYLAGKYLSGDFL